MAAINLDAYQLRFVNGANGTTYLTVDLPAVELAGGDYYVVCGNAATTPNCDLDVTPDTNLIQNGSPDGVVVETAAGRVDGLGYAGGDPMAGVTEGANATSEVANNVGEGLARTPDGCDTDNNANDFGRAAITPGASNGGTPCGGPPADAAPSVTGTSPGNGATHVALAGDVTITFSEPVDVAAGAVTIACSDSGAHQATLSGGPTTFTLNPDADFPRNETCTVTVSAAGVTDQDTDDPPNNPAGDFTFSFSTLGLAGLRIHDIQAAQHISPHDGDFVVDVPGIVTVVRGNGFYYQDPMADRDPETSEGIFVFTGSAGAKPAVGQAITVTGRVDEFRPGAVDSTNLTTTEITDVDLDPDRHRHDRADDRRPRRPHRADLRDRQRRGRRHAGEPGDAVRPAAGRHRLPREPRGHARARPQPARGRPYERLRGAPGGADFGLLAFPHTARGGIFVRPGDFNPERIILDDALGLTMPDASVRDRLSTVEAVVDYDFSNYKYLVTAPPTVTSGGLQREITQAPKNNELAVASMNVENLDPGDNPATIAALANILVTNMRSPDIVAIEEVQDNNGATNNGVVAADQTYATFTAAIVAAGGPTYEFRQIDPVNNADGGEPGGNIRVGFLFRTDRGLAFVDRPGGNATTATEVVDTPDGPELSLSPGRIDPTNPAFANSRKPLAGEFTWRGRSVFAVANHFNSKGGDDPLFGRFQPPVRRTEVQRHRQAAVVAGFVEDLLAADRRANVVVMGDLNDFEFSETLDILEDSGLENLMETLPPWERYSYVFDGNSQTLDQILVSDNLMRPRPEYDSVHVNAEFHDQASDHDPQVARLRVTGRP